MQIISLFSFLLVARVCIQGFIFGFIIDYSQFPSSLVVVHEWLLCVYVCMVCLLKNARVGCSLCSFEFLLTSPKDVRLWFRKGEVS